MKSLKLSLVAATLTLGTSVYAEDKAAVGPSLVPTHGTFFDNMKVGGQTTLYYQTFFKGDAKDGEAFSERFNKHSSFANVGFSLKFESDLGNDFGFGARLNVLDTLGLEGTLVNHTMQHIGGSQDNDGALNDEEMYFGEAYVTKTFGNTLFKLGRQELDTPLAYTEKWNVMPTTFDAAVVVNSDLATQGVTLVGAYVSKTNGHGGKPTGYGAPLGEFQLFGKYRAYAAAALYGNDTLKANAWFYNVPAIANAYWIDASTNVAGAKLTAISAGFMLDNEPADGSDKNTIAIGGSANYKVNENLTLFGAAVHTTGEKSSHTVSNIGTGGFKTKLPTATITGDGDVAGATDTTSFKAKASYSLGENGSIIGQAGFYMHGENSSVQTGSFKRTEGDYTATAVELMYKRKIASIDLFVAWSFNDNVLQASNEDETGDLFRIVGRYNF